MRAEIRFPVMGTTAHVVVLADAPTRVLMQARARLEQLEARWSRFRPDSDVSWLNRSAGSDVIVSADTVLLVERAIEGWRVTEGCYDPTVLGDLLRAGYTQDFASLPVAPKAAMSSLRLGAAEIEFDRATRRVHLPAGVGFDPGGIGKGLAADLVAVELLDSGAAGVCVNIGGDLRVAGDPPHHDGWRIDLDDPESGSTFARLALREGAVATSSPLRRRWIGPRGETHHLVDPRSGTVASTSARTATVVAAAAWQAEVLAKAAILGEVSCVERVGAAALVRERGRDVATATWSRFEPAMASG